jgi:hypothetical protein
MSASSEASEDVIDVGEEPQVLAEFAEFISDQTDKVGVLVSCKKKGVPGYLCSTARRYAGYNDKKSCKNIMCIQGICTRCRGTGQMRAFEACCTLSRESLGAVDRRICIVAYVQEAS